MLTRRALLSIAPAIGLPFFDGSEVRAQSANPNGFGVYMTHETTPQIIAQLAALPCEFVQLHLIWSRIGYRDYDWSYFDSIINPLAQSGKRLILMVGWSPIQKERNLSGQNLLDADGYLDYEQVEALEALLIAAMQRYPGPHIWCWEEEPDGWPVGGRGAWGGKYAEFVEVLRAFARARDAADSGAILAIPPVARENWAAADERPTYDMDFLARISDLGAFDLADMWGCNYYDGFDSHHMGGVFPLIRKLQQARDTLPTEHRFKPLLVNTGAKIGPGQSLYLRQSSAHLWAAPFLHGLNVQSFTWFAWQEWDGYGLDSTAEFERINRAMTARPMMARPIPNGYEFQLQDKAVNLRWCEDRDGDGAVGADDIQAVANEWRRGATLQDIMLTSLQFGEACHG